MNAEEKKAWDTLTFEIECSALEGYFFDVGNDHKPAIMAAARELKRLREVEKFCIEDHIPFLQREVARLKLLEADRAMWIEVANKNCEKNAILEKKVKGLKKKAIWCGDDRVR
jgi:hypothetical protein